MKQTSFIGHWKLVSAEFKSIDGTLIYPLGHNVIGRINYDDAGNMAAQLYNVDLSIAVAQGQSSGPGPWALCYFGRYEIDEQQQSVTHIVEGCTHPEWVGGRQLRLYQFNERQLVLSTPPIALANQQQTGTLVWERLV